jgi:catechol 2,3-dioxygenase-like lactoylglutathione lyase family enzyme
MSDNKEKSRIYATVIRTRNIERLRNFYRDIIELGPPIVDSNHWIEFGLGANSNLVIETIDDEQEGTADKDAKAKNAIDWALRVDDMDAEKKRLLDAKVTFVGEENERFGKRVIKCLDPDGNLIHLISE